MISRSKVPVKVQKLSGFNKSHFHLLTGTTGTLIPILVDEVIGNTPIYLRLPLAASMPPLAADTYMKTDVCVEAYFVPHRLCYGGFETFYTQRQEYAMKDTSVGPTVRDAAMPILQVSYGDDPNVWNFTRHRSLVDYLGWQSSGYTGGNYIFQINPAPLVAYHLIWQHYYRAPLVQKECFARPMGVGSGLSLSMNDPYFVSLLPYVTLTDTNCVIPTCINSDPNTVASFKLADGTSLFELRKRNFGYDYFTNAFPTPSLGSDVNIDTTGGSFTVGSLRAGTGLQTFKDINQIAGTRFQDTLMARTGASIKDGVANRPVLLGAAKYNCYNRSMLVSAINNASSTTNPFADSAGAVQGNMYASGNDVIIDNFVAKEPGYIMVLASLVPTVTYSTGCERILTRYRTPGAQITDMANHLLQGVGNQPIYQYELNGNIGFDDNNMPVFGYTDRFADWCVMKDRISGLFRSGLALESFVSQRYFAAASSPTINSSFLQIPTDYLDNIQVIANSAGQDYGFWLECAFDYKISQPLAKYSIPCLQDPAFEHGDTVSIHRGGFRF